MASSLSNFVNSLLKEFIKLNINTYTMTKNVKLAGWNTNIVITLLNTQTLIDDLIEKKWFNGKKKILTMISINLFYCPKKVFTHMNAWMTGEILMNYHYLKKKIYAVT